MYFCICYVFRVSDWNSSMFQSCPQTSSQARNNRKPALLVQYGVAVCESHSWQTMNCSLCRPTALCPNNILAIVSVIKNNIWLMQHKGSQAVPKPPLQINCSSSPGSTSIPPHKEQTPPCSSPAPIPCTSQLSQAATEQLAQAGSNLGFIQKASCGCEEYFSLTPVIHSCSMFMPCRNKPRYGLLQRKTVTHSSYLHQN